MADDSLEKIAHDLSAHGLQTQEAVLEELRRRAAALFTATAVAVAFLGSRAIDRPHHGLAVMGFIAAGFALVGCILVLLPKEKLYFTLSGSGVYEEFVKQRLSADDAYRWLAYWLQRMRNRNEGPIDDLVGTFKYSCLLLLAALGLWGAQFVVAF